MAIVTNRLSSKNLNNPKDPFWSRSVEENIKILGSSSSGLTEEEARHRLERYGPNSTKEADHPDPLRAFLNQFSNPLMLILIAATIISAVLKEFVDAIIIFLIITGSSYLSFTQEYHANLAAEKLKERLEIKCTVIRSGNKKKISIRDLVPGDIVLLSAGSLIPADGILLEAQDFYVSEAVLTGETYPVLKTPGIAAQNAEIAERTNSLFMGTSVRSGVAKQLIVKTGGDTIFGQISERIVLKAEETSFERGIRQFGNFLMIIMLIMVLLVFAMNVFLKKPVLDSLLFSVSLAVGITPVLLPAIVNVTLSKGTQKMAKNGVIVRKLNAIENLGSMDILCTDKTGTITSGVIRLDRALDVDGNDSEMIRRMAFYNAHFESGIENPLDEAITNSLSFPLDKVSKQGEIPYDFMRRRLSVIVQESSQKTMLITKGAFDQVLSVCSSFQSSVGVSGLTDSVKQKIQMQYESWSNAGYRVLCLAYREIESKEIYSRTDEDHLILVGYLLFRDPPKNGIQEVVKELKESGVGLKIITGDNRYVAKHIAGEIGLNKENILTGDDLDQMKDEALWHLAEKTDLFAEVDPNQKERIISALRKMGHTIGFMGDGINDAPALHAADVGISVENAVDVTKEAADLVLLNQDLNILLTGIRLGRTSFTNTMKYIHITTSANFGNMFSMAGISLLIPFLPMLPMQILLTNFLTDIPAMGISDDSVDDDLIKGHTKWDINFIRRFMVVFGIASSVFDFLTFFFLIRIFKVDESTFQTAWFLESVMTELFILLIIRTRKMFLLSRPSKGLLLSIFVMAAITILLTILPVNHYLGLINLPRSISLTIIGLVVFYVVINEILKKIFYRMNPL